MKSIIKKYNQCANNRKFVVDILAIFFGIGAWIGVNGMFVQLPLLVNSAPEKWNLPSYMSIAVQIANIGPIMYALGRRFFPEKLNDAYCIYSVLFTGFIAAILMAFLYDYLIIINGEPHSAVFLILVFFTAIVGCTSSVLFFPYMGNFKEIYIFTYFIGEGLSGFIPSIVALVQGIGNPECVVTQQPDGNRTDVVYHPLFDTQYYFLFIALALAFSFCGFVLLNNLKMCASERVSTTNKERLNEREPAYDMHEVEITKTLDIYKFPDAGSITSHTSITIENKISPLRATILLILMAIVCGFGNGIFPSIQSYSCLPYGNNAYHLAVTLSSMANPVACFMAVFLPRTSNRSISFLSVICAIFLSYAIATSVLSPTPPLVGTVAGIVIVVLVWIIVVGLVSYIKLCISTIFRSEGGSWMFYCGGISQTGSAIGSLLSFFLINYTKIFVPSSPCKS